MSSASLRSLTWCSTFAVTCACVNRALLLIRAAKSVSCATPKTTMPSWHKMEKSAEAMMMKNDMLLCV